MIVKNYCKLFFTVLWLKTYAKIKAIRGNQKFPRFRNGVSINWESKSRDIISDKGILTYTEKIKDADKVQFIATLSINKNYFSDEKEKLRIKVGLVFRYEALSVNERLQLSYDELTYKKILGANKDSKNVISNLTLIGKSSYGIDIKWYSSDENCLKGNRVKRGDFDRKVFLIAELTGGGYERRKQFEFVVKAESKDAKKVLIMVPHGDDEIFMSYSVLRKAVLKNYQVHVCFFCNVDTKGIDNAIQRHKESLQALEYLGVKKDRIYCLGYSTKWKGMHIYNQTDKLHTSINGDVQTYGSKYITDWHFLRTGSPALYIRENVVNDICDVIMTILPDVIFVNDFDKHIDHTAYSLFFEEAMGICLKKNVQYAPLVYKGFVYSTGAYGKPVFFKKFVPYTHKPSHESSYYPLPCETELENPSLHWNDRVRFKTDKELLNKDIHFNPAINALLMYHRMYRNIPCFIKRDTVFWQRRTDNLLLNAKIKASSGNVSFLNDFKLTDTKKLDTVPYKFDAGEWIPDEIDKKKEIEIEFLKKVRIGRLRFYRNRGKAYVTEVSVSFNNKVKIYRLFNKDEAYKDIIVNVNSTDKLIINVISRKGKRTGFTEIEAYNK